MKILFPPYVVFAFLLLVVQTYLLIYVALLLLRRLKLLKRPYSGMDYSESLIAAILVLGVLTISSTDASEIFQATKSYGDSHARIAEPSLLAFARSFLVILFFSLLFIILNFLNIRFLFKGYIQSPSLPVSMLLCAIAIGFDLVCWFTCKEIIDNMTPRLINFQ
jgi:hypothetical protein